MNRTACLVAIAALVMTSGCKKIEPGETKIDEAVATKASDDLLAAALTGDVAKIDALYASDVVAVDAGAPEIGKGGEAMHKFNAGFVGLKFDKMAYTDRQIQVLDGEDFIVTAKVHAESSKGPIKATDFRLTDVFRKQADGGFKIVNEHVSFPGPK